MNILFVRVPVADGRNLAVNAMLVEAIEDNGQTIKIAIGGKWLELNMTVEQFIEKCNYEPEED